MDYEGGRLPGPKTQDLEAPILVGLSGRDGQAHGPGATTADPTGTDHAAAGRSSWFRWPILCLNLTARPKTADGANRGVQSFLRGARRRGGLDHRDDVARAADGLRATAVARRIRRS